MEIEWKKKNKEEVLIEQDIFLKNKGCIPLLKYPLLETQDWFVHCFTTRQGGVSRGMYESLNLSFTRGDNSEDVRENFMRVAEALKVSASNFVFSDQTHTNHVRKITREDAGNGFLRPKNFFDVDGMITDEPGIVLSTFYADCVPLYFADPTHKAVGLSHSGWKGTVGRIGAVTLERMKEEYGTKPEEVFCAIGPSICQDCYEVSGDVAELFQKEFLGETEEILEDKGNGKYQLNLWKANEKILLKSGVKREHLAVTNLCTCCNSSRLFSHRATAGKRGNLGAFISIKE